MCVCGQLCDGVVNGKSSSCGVSLLETQFYLKKWDHDNTSHLELSGELDYITPINRLEITHMVSAQCI